MITNPPVKSRKNEKKFVEEHLREHFGGNNPDFPIYYLAETPEEEETLAFEGGNVIRFGKKHFFVGINRRTNMEGFQKFQKILQRVNKGYTATAVPIQSDILHLKCFVTYLGNGYLIGEGETLKNYKEFDGIKLLDTTNLGKIGNVIKINEYLLIEKKAPTDLVKQIEKMGLKVLFTTNTEFCKVDGDITCRNLLI